MSTELKRRPRSRRSARAVQEREVTFTLEHDSDGVSEGDGRNLEGYAAVFNSPTQIDDAPGSYTEVIKPGAFTHTIRNGKPPLMFNHGRHPLIGTMPIGTTEELREDSRGLFVRARLFDNWMVGPLAQAIREEAVSGMSFRFEVPKGKDTWTTENGQQKRIVREVKLHELGPVVFPAYADAQAALRTPGPASR
jgi:HK97 family phage prohead protease